MQSQSVRTDLYFFSFERGASVSPSANAVGKENSQPSSSEITISARRASERAARATGPRAMAAEPRLFAALICSLVMAMNCFPRLQSLHCAARQNTEPVDRWNGLVTDLIGWNRMGLEVVPNFAEMSSVSSGHSS